METSVQVLRFLETLQRAFWNTLAKVGAEPPISQWEQGRLLSIDEFGASRNGKFQGVLKVKVL